MKHLSASRLMLYADCGLKYKFIYIDKIYKPVSSVHLAYGSAVHKALEYLNISMMKEKCNLEDVYQAFDEEWNKQIEEQKVHISPYLPDYYKMGLYSLEKFYNEFSDYEVIGSEMKFDVPIIYPDGTKEDLNMYGLIDAVIKLPNNQLLIVDYKTSKEQFNRFKLNSSIQLAMYSYAFRHLLSEGKFPDIKKGKEDYISYYVILKDNDTLQGDIKIQKKKITDAHYKRMFYNIKNVLKGIRNEVFVPNYNSTCHWCDYRKECLDENLIKL